MKTFEAVIKNNIANVKKELKRLDIEAIARKTGIIQRAARKLSASNLLLALLALSSGCAPTMEKIASIICLILGESYSKQALSKRLGAGIDQFLGQVAAQVFTEVQGRSVTAGVFAAFNRVLLHDSTALKLPERFHASFKGCSNQNKRMQSTMKIQLVSDLLSGRILHLSLSGFTRNDQAASGDILAEARPGDLVLRDLGYFVSENFRIMIERGIFFLSRYHHASTLLALDSGKAIDLCQMLKKQTCLDIDALLGIKSRVPVRLVCCPVPEQVANKRRRKAKRNRRNTSSQKHLFLMGWDIFISNVGRDVWEKKDFQPVYRLRWRIEIMFKAWKSHLRIRELNFSSEPMLRLSIMTKLLFCALTHNTCAALELMSPNNMHVSLLRTARILADCASLVAAMVLDIHPAQFLSYLIQSQAFYEQRHDRENYTQLITALSLG